MMTSSSNNPSARDFRGNDFRGNDFRGKSSQAYVWVWLPEQSTPIVAGKLEVAAGLVRFNYGQSYLKRSEHAQQPAISLFEDELPLRAGVILPKAGLTLPSCIRDASPDAWGRRVIINKMLGKTEMDPAADSALNELTFLMESGSDRIGALDFQASPTVYVPRQATNVSLAELMTSAERVEQGVPLSPELDQALFHGSSIGGARPKALIEQGDKKYIAKFSSSTDLYSVVKAEFIAMRLASLCGLNVATVSLVSAAKKDVLLIERFDRVKGAQGWQRRAMVSALTLFGLDDMMARYASYEQLCELIRKRFEAPSATLKELFGRLVFNILCGNTDDHARNHAAFWNGKALSLTPAYDVCPQGRSGGEATQAMLIRGDDRLSQVKSCIEAAPQFLLSREAALSIYQHQRVVIETNWERVCDEAVLSAVDRNVLRGRQFLNPFAFEGLGVCGG
jgi:serine/threonine-protein kinase HipA